MTQLGWRTTRQDSSNTLSILVGGCMGKCLQLVVGGFLSLLIATTASATIISGNVTGGSALADGGTFIKLVPPLANPFGPANSVGNDTFQSPNLFGFDEDQNIVLGAPLVVDIGSSPLPAGTTVASHYIFFDPVNESISGTVDFDANVLAIITSTTNLANSDFLANTGVNYLSPTLRGLESGEDTVIINGPSQILLNFSASTPGDYIRVLTAFSPTAKVPEPGTLLLLGSGLAGVAALRRKFTA